MIDASLRRAPRLRALPLACAAALACSSLAPGARAQEGRLPDDLRQRVLEVHPGEPLDPATYGPGFVESIEAALERDRLRPPGRIEDERDPLGMPGVWAVPSRGAAGQAHSGAIHLTNENGDPRMGVAFPVSVDLQGAWIGGQSDAGAWPPAVRALGFRDGVEVAASAWLEPITAAPQWLEMGFSGVDRFVIEARPALRGRAFFTLDDLAYTPLGGRAVVLDFEDLAPRARLSGSGYAGLLWEPGSGNQPEPAVQGPVVPPRPAAPLDAAPPAAGGFLGGSGTAPTLLDDFEGTQKGEHGSSTYPPDTCGFVGPDHFVEVINRVFAVYDKQTGQKLVGMNLGSFLPGSNGDPRVFFDHTSQRWFVLATDFSDQERMFLAVSTTSSATGSWFKTSFFSDQGSDAGCWPDYPTFGFNQDGVYIGAYMVGCGMTLWVLDKAPLVAPSPSLGSITAFRNLSLEGALQACVTYGDPGVEYVVSTSGTSSIRVRRVAGPITNPSLTTVATINVGSHPDAPNAPALGSSVNINTVDDRLMNAVYRDGSIWCAHNVSSSGRAACRWYELGTAPFAMLQKGTVTDPARHYYFPGIAVNANGDVLLGFSGSKSDEYVGTYYAGRLASDPPDELSTPIQFRAGQAAQNNIDNYGRNRWGDYSLSSVDPTDELTLWTIQEYAHANNVWGTHVAVFEYPDSGGGCTDPTSFCVATPNSVGPGALIGWSGTPSVSAQDLALTVTAAPGDTLGIFYYGDDQTQVPFGDGVRCVEAGLVGTFRLPVVQTDFFGDVVYPLDWSSAPIDSGPGAIVSGTLWYFQFWYRDTAGGPAGFNLSDGLSVTFCP